MFLEIKNVEMKYDKFEAVKGISFGVEKGCIHGLIGENGAGKTTLIRCIMGIYKPFAGEVLVDGENVYENPKVKMRMGFVGDTNKFLPTYRLGKVAEFYKDMYEKFDMNKLAQLNQIFKLDMNKRVGDLSRGQQMRFAFMLNMAANTEILVMDEPTSGIDAIAKKEFFEVLVKEVEERNLTVLITSHDIMDLEKICDTVTLVKGGKVIGNDGLDQVIQSVRKFNFVFKNGAPEEFLAHSKVVSYSNTGSIYTVVFSGITEEEIEAMKKYEPEYVEELKVNLEEVFVYANGGEQVEK